MWRYSSGYPQFEYGLTFRAACAWVNYQNGFHVPIMAILCDDKHFYFFQFADRRQTNASSQLFLGKFADGDRRVNIDDIELNPSADPRAFVRQIRNICDSLYYVFLSGYQSGLEAYWNRRVERVRHRVRKRHLIPAWLRVCLLGDRITNKIVGGITRPIHLLYQY